MPDRDLRDAARAVERSVSPPDFSTVVARGEHVRRRRRQRRVVLSTVAAGVVAAAVLAPWIALRPGRHAEPVAPPPTTDSERTAVLLADPDAHVDEAATVVADTGAVLQRVVVPSPVGGRCEGDRRSALVWRGADGTTSAWSSDVTGRGIAAVPGGFVVGAPSPACARALGEVAAAHGAYVVDSQGDRRAVDWSGGAEEVCGPRPAAPGCVVSATSASGYLLDGGRDAPAPTYLPLSREGRSLWASSSDATRLAWSDDGGHTWSAHRTQLQPRVGETVQATAAGDVALFFAWPRAEVTRDHGRSWQVVDLTTPLEPVLVANPVLTVSSTGRLVGVSYPTDARPFVFASTDPTWQHFRRSGLRTDLGDFDVRAAGRWFYTPDGTATWVSADGLAWHRVATGGGAGH